MLSPTYGVDNDRKFRNALQRAKDEVADLTLPLGLIAKDFYKSEKAIFKLQSPGQYEDLTPRYKPRKLKKAGFLYPILRLTGRLESSVTDPDDADAIFEIVNKDTLRLGTRVRSKTGVSYPTILQRKRPFFFIGPEAPRYATSEMQGRLTRWNNILNGYVLKKMGAEVTVKDLANDFG